MTTTGGDAQRVGPRHDLEDATDRDPRNAARAARLMRWYPTRWRERYGDEFAEVLASSMSDGKGSFRLSWNVAREGMAARLEEAGFLGRTAPPLQRARASIVASFLAISAFLASAAALIRYAKGWQRSPAVERLTQAAQSLFRSGAHRTYVRTLNSPSFHQLQLAAARTLNPNSPAWKALDKARAQATSALNRSQAGRTYQDALHFRPASGAPVIFNEVAQIALLATLACSGTALLVMSVAGVRAVRGGSTARLRLPLTLVLGSAALLVIGGISFEADHKIPPGQPGSELQVLKWMLLDGQFRFWPVVVLPVCVVGSIVLATVGGVQLIGRVDMGPRSYRIQGYLAKATAGCLGIALVSTMLWVITLTVQVPSFLTAKDQGILGTALLPVFLVAVAVMAVAMWIVASGSARCLRSVRRL
jgi:hypothetical protein